MEATVVAPQVPILDKYFSDGHEALHAPRTNRMRDDKGRMTAETRFIEAVIMESLPVAVFSIPTDVAIKAMDEVEGMKPYLAIKYRNTPIYLHNVGIDAVKNGDVIQAKARLVLKRVRTRVSGQFEGGSAYYLHLDLLECAVVASPKDIPDGAIMLSVPKIQNVNKDEPVIDSYMIQVCASKVRAEELNLAELYSSEELGDLMQSAPPAPPVARDRMGRVMKTRRLVPEDWVPPTQEPIEQTKPTPAALAPAPKAETKPEPPPEPPKAKAGKGKKNGKAGRKDGLQKVEGDGTFGALAKLMAG